MGSHSQSSIYCHSSSSSFLIFFVCEDLKNRRFTSKNKDNMNETKTSKKYCHAVGGPCLIDFLPDECLLHIFSFLPLPRDRCSCAAVSKKWLFLQLHMRHAELYRSKSDGTFDVQIQLSRSLKDEKANDVRLATLAVASYPNTLTVLNLLQGFPAVPNPPLHHQVVTDLGLKIIGFAFSNLKSIALANCTYVSDDGLAWVARGCRALEKLYIRGSPLISDVGLTVVAESCSFLSALSLDSCPLIGSPSLIALAKQSMKLESISLMKCHRIDDYGVISLVSSLPKLAKLSLISMQISDGVLEAIGEQGKALQLLRLESVHGPTELGYCCAGLTDTRFTSLTQLEIKNCSSLTDLSLIELAKQARKLETLEIQKSHEMTNNGLMEALSIWSRTLRKVSLVKCDLSNQTDTVDRVGGNLVLQSLKLKRCNGVGEALLSWMGAACRQAKKVALAGMSSVTDRALCAFLKSLDGASHATSLDLSGCVGISDWGVIAMMMMAGRKLERLNLSGCKGLSNASLGMIWLMCPNLQDLDLSQCAVGNETLLRLSGLRLKILALAGCRNITDEGLAYLELMCAGLHGLNLNGCSGISDEGVESVRASLWWCDLVS